MLQLNNRWFNGQPIHAELSPVTDFREACCRQYEMGWVTVPYREHALGRSEAAECKTIVTGSHALAIFCAFL